MLFRSQGFTISGARNKLQELVQEQRERRLVGPDLLAGVEILAADPKIDESKLTEMPRWQLLRRELSEIRELLA